VPDLPGSFSRQQGLATAAMMRPARLVVFFLKIHGEIGFDNGVIVAIAIPCYALRYASSNRA
jgi:pseudouridine-5'-phosphate glycosidase